MIYSWYNISEQYKNNKIRYGVLSEERDENKKVNPFVITYYPIEFSPESYSYDNINEYIKDILIGNNRLPETIKLKFDLSKFKCQLTLKKK